MNLAKSIGKVKDKYIKKLYENLGDRMEGEEFILKPKKEMLRFECCDCKLVHDFEFVIKDLKEIGITIKRNNHSTGQLRRKE